MWRCVQPESGGGGKRKEKEKKKAAYVTDQLTNDVASSWGDCGEVNRDLMNLTIIYFNFNKPICCVYVNNDAVVGGIMSAASF